MVDRGERQVHALARGGRLFMTGNLVVSRYTRSTIGMARGLVRDGDTVREATAEELALLNRFCAFIANSIIEVCPGCGRQVGEMHIDGCRHG